MSDFELLLGLTPTHPTIYAGPQVTSDGAFVSAEEATYMDAILSNTDTNAINAPFGANPFGTPSTQPSIDGCLSVSVSFVPVWHMP